MLHEPSYPPLPLIPPSRPCRTPKYVIGQTLSPSHTSTNGPPNANTSFCIIGAGAAGLYTAMILDSLGIQYEILEANERIGGRIYTHRFNGEIGRNAPVGDPARYDYIDIGAMRYPRLPSMNRTFDLFERLDIAKDGLLIEYKMQAENTFEMFNGIRVQPDAAQVLSELQDIDVFKMSKSQGGNIPDNFVKRGVESVAAEVFKPFMDKFREEDFQTAWSYVMKHAGAYTTRGYMLDKLKFSPAVVDWLETFLTATGAFNFSLLEGVVELYNLSSGSSIPGEKEVFEGWNCIDGGSDHIIQRMLSKLTNKPITSTRVVGIASTRNGMEVKMRKKDGTILRKQYSQVISTVPIGCLTTISIPRDDLSYTQRSAIRALGYDNGTKIALRFKSRWWEDPSIMNGKPIRGGISPTDLPIRQCIYPSYGLDCSVDDPSKVPGTLLVGYTWAQDSQRLSGLSYPNGDKKSLLNLTLQNLSELHGIPVEKFGPVEDFFVYNWQNNENAMGAFALFPCEATDNDPSNCLFASMKTPAAGGKLHFAGEATSVQHGWVVAALNSGWRAVYNALARLDGGKELQKELVREWNVPDEEDRERYKWS